MLVQPEKSIFYLPHYSSYVIVPWFDMLDIFVKMQKQMIILMMGIASSLTGTVGLEAIKKICEIEIIWPVILYLFTLA